jgi:hypothetical protein
MQGIAYITLRSALPVYQCPAGLVQPPQLCIAGVS